MKADNLMLNDWVYNSKGERCKVHSISNMFESNIQLDNYDKENDGCFELEIEVNPIPLKSEFMEKYFPNDKTDINWTKVVNKSTVFNIQGDDIFKIYVNDGMHEITAFICYIHELQHICNLIDLKINIDYKDL